MRKHVIYVVDDQKDLRDSICEELNRAGYTAVGAQHGDKALALLRKGAPPSLLLLDLLMPERDGWEVVAAMKADPALKNVPIVVMSAVPPRATTLQAQGVAGTLPKPFTLAQGLFLGLRVVKAS